MSKQINTARTNASIFEQMISKTNFKINYSSMVTWLAVALAATAKLRLFIFSIIYFFKQRLILIPQPQQTSSTLSYIQIPNSSIAYNPNQLPQQIQQQLHPDYFLSKEEMLKRHSVKYDHNKVHTIFYLNPYLISAIVNN
jgi:hypothetical protein